MLRPAPAAGTAGVPAVPRRHPHDLPARGLPAAGWVGCWASARRRRRRRRRCCPHCCLLRLSLSPGLPAADPAPCAGLSSATWRVNSTAAALLGDALAPCPPAAAHAPLRPAAHAPLPAGLSSVTWSVNSTAAALLVMAIPHDADHTVCNPWDANKQAGALAFFAGLRCS